MTEDLVARLQRLVLPDRFETFSEPLGWRCRACGVRVTAGGGDAGTEEGAVAGLSERAADHALQCGRCED